MSLRQHFTFLNILRGLGTGSIAVSVTQYIVSGGGFQAFVVGFLILIYAKVEE